MTLNYENYNLTIIKSENIFTFTFVSNLNYLNKNDANEVLKKFLLKHEIFNFEIMKSLKWIHKKDVFYNLKNRNLIKNLIPIGDSFFHTDPSNGLGLTAILLKSIYICKNICRFENQAYFNFSKKLFNLIVDQPITFSKKNFLFKKLKKFRNLIPFYSYLRNSYEVILYKKKFKEILKEL